MITTCFGYCVDYDDGGTADGYYDNVDQQRIEEAISSHDPRDVFAEQVPIGGLHFVYHVSPSVNYPMQCYIMIL